MKLEVYNPEAPKEEVLRLALEKDSDGVDLVAVDEDGDRIDGGYILTVQNSGSLKLHSGCRAPGLQFDGADRIEVEGRRADDDEPDEEDDSDEHMFKLPGTDYSIRVRTIGDRLDIDLFHGGSLEEYVAELSADKGLKILNNARPDSGDLADMFDASGRLKVSDY